MPQGPEKIIPFSRRYRHYILLLLLLLAYMGTMAGVLRYNRASVDEALGRVNHRTILIGKTQHLALLVERMLASWRGHVLSGDETLLAQYGDSKKAASDLIVELGALMKDDAAQTRRLSELQHHFLTLSEHLDSQGAEAAPSPAHGINWTPGEKERALNAARDSLMRVAGAALEEEERLLSWHARDLKARRRGGRTLFVGAGAAFILLLFGFNAYILRLRPLPQNPETPADDVFRIASEGISDGVFSWNLADGRAFYSRQFWAMLGHEPGKFPDTRQFFESLLHPDDRERVLSHIESYISGEIPEYLIVFRMRHQSGRWIWINARARALYDDKGRPARLVGVHTDISHIKAYEEKLQKAKEYAESANRAKTDFLAHMSHEIRTPLTAISGIAEIFENAQDNLDPRQKQLVRILGSSTASLKDLVNDILDFSRIEGGELELDEKTFTLGDLFDQVIGIMSLKAGEKGITFTFDYSGIGRRKILGDRARLRQVLINLVGNAVKFTDKGSVTVTASGTTAEDGTPTLRVDIRDTGIGIEPRNFDLIFERFKQADPSVSRRYGGSGLGLPISLRLARLMGGNITVDSTPGKGSVFTFSIPLKTPPGEARAEEDTALRRESPETPAAHVPDGKKVLLVEDYEGNVAILSYLLDSLGCGYDVAHTGLEALNMWKDRRYDLILMDVQMPEMDGFTATTHIRRMEREKDLPRTPIIGMTAHALVGDREKCIESGMDAYLPKPIVEADLKTLITGFLWKDKAAA